MLPCPLSCLKTVSSDIYLSHIGIGREGSHFLPLTPNNPNPLPLADCAWLLQGSQKKLRTFIKYSPGNTQKELCPEPIPQTAFSVPWSDLRNTHSPQKLQKPLSRVQLEIPEVQQFFPLLAPSLGFFNQFGEDFCSLRGNHKGMFKLCRSEIHI